jgi:hypothetical protein
MAEKQKSVFETLSAINVNEKVEKKNGLTYLSWAWAWGEVKKVYPDATYSVVRDTQTNQVYTYDPTLGYMVMTAVTIQGQTLEMWLPVMDGANKAMKQEPYTYPGSKWENGRKVTFDKTCDAADMFDINKALMRCLTKNLAMFGLGHYIFAGEDLPEGEAEAAVQAAPKAKSVAPKAAPAVPASAKPALKKDTEDWDKVVKWIGDNKQKTLEEINRLLSQRYSITPAVLKSIETILTTNG